MGDDKSLVDLRCSINSNCMRVHPYSVDRAYSTLTKVECLLLMNTIFLMDDMFNTNILDGFTYIRVEVGSLPMRT